MVFKGINDIEFINYLEVHTKKDTMKKFHVTEKQWKDILVTFNISYDRKEKKYVMSQLEGLEDEKVDVVEDINENSTEEVINVNKDNTIDILEYISKDVSVRNKEEVANNEIYEEVKENIDEEISEEVLNTTENADSSKKEEKSFKESLKGYTLYKQQIPKRLYKALQYKALAEGVNLEELVIDMLWQSIENKYYKGIQVK